MGSAPGRGGSSDMLRHDSHRMLCSAWGCDGGRDGSEAASRCAPPANYRLGTTQEKAPGLVAARNRQGVLQQWGADVAARAIGR